MRIWLGTEQEFGTEDKTLYIEGEKVNVDTVLSLAKKHKVSRLYLGAGKSVFNDFSILSQLIHSPYAIYLETSDPSTIPKTLSYYIMIIQRVESNTVQLLHNSILKVETPHFVYTIPLSLTHQTSLNSSNYNSLTKTYKEDVIIYDSESQGESKCLSK